MFELTRRQAYELAWSRPMQELAKLLEVSNVALAKSFRQSGIPTPARGYWNKIAAGHRVVRAKLSAPHLGTASKVWISGELANPSRVEGEPGHVSEPDDLAEMEQRFRKLIRSVGVPRLDKTHMDIRRLIEKAEEKERRYAGTFLETLHKNPYATSESRRRLRVMGALLIAGDRYGQAGRLWNHGRDKGDLEAHVTFGGASITCRVDYLARKDKRVLSVWIPAAVRTKEVRWQDRPGAPVERQLTEIVVTIARMSVETEWQMDADIRLARLKATAAMEERRRAAEAEASRAVAARKTEQEKLQTEALLRAAEGHERAKTIRKFVVDMLTERSGDVAAQWAKWALEKADAIDPTRNGFIEESIATFSQHHGDDD